MASSLIHIALFASTIRTFGKPLEASFHDIAALLAAPAGAKKKGQAFIAAYLKATHHSCVRRRKSDLYGVSMLALDFDAVEVTEQDLPFVAPLLNTPQRGSIGQLENETDPGALTPIIPPGSSMLSSSHASASKRFPSQQETRQAKRFP